MKISSSSINFQENESLRIFEIQNTSSKSLIFKIRITNPQLYSISPGRGIMKPLEKTTITIKPIKLTDLIVKLLICSAELEHVTQQTIDQQLDKINKQLQTNTIIPISRSDSKKISTKQESGPMFKKTESPLYQIQFSKEDNQYQNVYKNMNTSRGLNKSLSLNSSSNLYQSIDDLDKKQINFSCLQYERLEKQLKNQKDKNMKMKQKLFEQQAKIRYYEDIRQSLINQTIENSDNSEWNYCNIILAALILIIIGFFISKTQSITQYSL